MLNFFKPTSEISENLVMNKNNTRADTLITKNKSCLKATSKMPRSVNNFLLFIK